MMQEKRKFIRIETEFLTWIEVDSTLPGYSDLFGVFRSKNLGGGGILVELDRSIPVGTLLKLNFQLPMKKDIEAKGKVVRSIELSEKKFDVGIEFIQINPEDKKTIIKFCESK